MFASPYSRFSYYHTEKQLCPECRSICDGALIRARKLEDVLERIVVPRYGCAVLFSSISYVKNDRAIVLL